MKPVGISRSMKSARCGMISGEKGRRRSLGRRVFGIQQSLGNESYL